MDNRLARFGERVGRKVRAIIPIIVGSTVLVLLLSLVLTGIHDYLPADAKIILSRLQAGDLVEARRLLHSSIGQSGAWQYGAFLALQILQVVFAPIPSQATGLLGGYLFGFWVGLGLTMLGLTIGSTLAVIAGRLLGASLVGRLVPARMRAPFERLVGESEIWSFLFIFMLPIFPGDSVCFIAGLTRLPLWQLVLASAVGRLPGMAMPEVIGSHWSRTVQADVVAVSWRERAILIGECTWGADPVNRQTLRQLVGQLAPAPRLTPRRCCANIMAC